MEPQENENAGSADFSAPEVLSFDDALGRLNGANEAPVEENTAPPEAAEAAETEGQAEQAEAPEGADAEPVAEPEPEEVIHGNAKTRLRDGTVVAVADLKKAFEKAREYEAKQQEHETRQREVDAKAQAIAQQEQFFTTTIQQAKAVLQRSFPPQPDPSLRETDPIEYFMQKDRYEGAVREWQRLDHAERVAKAESERKAQEAKAQKLQAEQARLIEKVPELKSEEGRKAFKSDVLKHAPDYDFTEADIGQIEDARVFRLFKDAIAYRKLQAEKAKAAEKTKDVPPVPVQAPGRRVSAPERSAQAVTEKLEAARRSGGMSFDDALALANQL